MLKLSRETAPVEQSGPVKMQVAEADGYTAHFVTFEQEFDQAPFFKGLPNDMCQCPHWGYVLSGRVKFRFADGEEEVFEPGDAFYAPPGHVPEHDAGTEYLQFSPTKELEETSAVIMQNMQQLQQPG